MKFAGFQKLTLLDYPTKTACTLFTKGCNFRCPFCHNASLVLLKDPLPVYEEQEVLSFLKKRQGLLDGVCVTGGEPLLHKDLESFLSCVKELGYSVKLDTNGSNPQYLRKLVQSGLVDYVAMDIKNSIKKYPQTVGVSDFDVTPIQESIGYLLSGAVDYEFRTTVVKEFHTPQDIEDIAQTIQGATAYYLQNFEDSGCLIEDGLHAVGAQTLELMRISAAQYVNTVGIRGV